MKGTALVVQRQMGKSPLRVDVTEEARNEAHQKVLVLTLLTLACPLKMPERLLPDPLLPRT